MNAIVKSFTESLLIQKCLLFSIVFVFYFNAIPNETALDDVLVVSKNEFVQKGIAGIPDIFTHNSFYGASGHDSGSSSWRYRPLSVMFFAVEYQFFKNNWHASCHGRSGLT